MARPKIEISNAALLKRMKRYEEITGKEIASSLRRGGRLLAVSLAKATPPFGFSIKDKDPEKDDAEPSSLHKGEKALFRDVFRVFYIMTKGRIRGILDFQGREATFKYGHKGAAPLGNVTEKILTRGQMKAWHQARRGKNGRVGMVHRGVTTGHRIRDLIHLDKGIVTQEYVESYYKERVKLVGLSKAAWASCIMKMDLSKSDIKNIWSGIPAWVKRHVSRVPSGVTDKCDLMFPEIKLTNRLPWANSVMSANDYREALRITREKFMKSMNKEIKAVLKKAAAA
jgi:hypothetical protein